jgi:hypothetical protein
LEVKSVHDAVAAAEAWRVLWRGEQVLIRSSSRPTLLEGPSIDVVVAAGQAPVPKLLFGHKTSLHACTQERCKLLAQEAVQQRKCYVLELPQVLDVQVTLWIDCDVPVIRQLTERHLTPLSVPNSVAGSGQDVYYATQTYLYTRVDVNVPLDEGCFSWEWPAFPM